MNINKLNLANLTSLWQAYGTVETNKRVPSILRMNKHWPHRCWIDRTELSNEKVSAFINELDDDDSWIMQIPEHAIFSLQPLFLNSDTEYRNKIEQQLLKNNWQISFSQTAMYLPLENCPTINDSDNNKLEVKRVTTTQDIKKWVNISSEAFAYQINTSVIEQLVSNPDIQILLASINNAPIASSLLYETGTVTGLHQMGVKKAYQGQGLAREFMNKIISICNKKGRGLLTLQASEVGLPLYESLGFIEQFQIHNFYKK